VLVLALALITAGLLLAVPEPSFAGGWRSCGDQPGRGAGYYNVFARNIGCKAAKGVAYEWTWEGGFETGEARGFTCDDKRTGYEDSRVSCSRVLAGGRTQQVKFKAGA
jgi:hypothetical protein